MCFFGSKVFYCVIDNDCKILDMKGWKVLFVVYIKIMFNVKVYLKIFIRLKLFEIVNLLIFLKN